MKKFKYAVMVHRHVVIDAYLHRRDVWLYTKKDWRKLFVERHTNPMCEGALWPSVKLYE